MKNKVFWITYMAFATNHMLRTCYAFNKAHIKIAFGLSDIHLGLLDALIYISYGLAIIGRYWFNRTKDLTELYLKSCILISVFFSIIPFISVFVMDSDIVRIENHHSFH